jgi:hypothetical protein
MRAAPEIAGQRSTSTDQPEREFARAVAASELCDDGLMADGIPNAQPDPAQ